MDGWSERRADAVAHAWAKPVGDLAENEHRAVSNEERNAAHECILQLLILAALIAPPQHTAHGYNVGAARRRLERALIVEHRIQRGDAKDYAAHAKY